MTTRLSFTLVQHTPMIHFQGSQTGATLRATELKPKLDRYLIEHGFRDDFSKYKVHLVGWAPGKTENDFKEKKAFDYKIRISATGITTQNIKARYPLYFGNLGKEADDKCFNFTPHPIQVTVSSFNTAIMERIQNHFANFLMETNFGTRQSKGFGSFYLSPKDPAYKRPSAPYQFELRFSQAIRGIDDYRGLFSQIDLFYKTLRAGINLKNRDRRTTKFYFKSMMFKYAKDYGIQWEKKTIKKHFFKAQLQCQKKQHTDSDALNFSSDDYQNLMKDMLGLSTTESWGYYKATLEKKHLPQKGGEKIERFKSPLTFKIILDSHRKTARVFLLTLPIPKAILDQEFEIQKQPPGDSEGLSLKTCKGFSMDHFLKFAIRQDLKSHVAEKFQNCGDFRILNKIYTQLKENLGGHHD